MGIIDRDGALWMATGIDNSGLYSGFNQAESRVDQFEAHIKRAGDNITRITGIGFGIAGLKAFGDKIVDVRGEMQMLETSFEVLLGGKGVAGFTSELKKFAVDSPLSLTGVSQAAQTLLGFGIAADNVMPTIKQLGDVSMGNEERFKSLSLAFAQMSAAGKLMGNDLLQFISAGFNPLQTISEKTGKSIGELKKDMENGAISSQMVADAFASATAEGGKFYGMTQKQAEGIRGLQAQLEGGLQEAFNEIGKSQEGLIAGGYKIATTLVENYGAIGKVLMGLVATYGIYKAALVVINTLEKANIAIIRQAVLEKNLAAMANIKLSSAEAYQIASKKILTFHTLNLTKAMKAQALSMVTNPAILMTAALVGLGWSVYKLTTYESDLTKAHKEASRFQSELTTEIIKESAALDTLFGKLKETTEGTDNRKKIVEQLTGQYGEYLGKQNLETANLNQITIAQKEANAALEENIRLKKLNQESENIKNNLTQNIEKYTDQIDKLVTDVDSFGIEAGTRISVRLQQAIQQAISDGTTIDRKAFIDNINKDFGATGKMLEMDLYSNMQMINRELSNANTGLSLIERKAKVTLEESQKLNKGDKVDSKTPKAIQDQIFSTSKSVQDLKKELQDLQKGIIPAASKDDAGFDFAKTIEEKTKSLKDAENKLNLLLHGKSTSEIEKGNKTGESAERKAESAVQKMRDTSLKLLNLQAELDNESVKQQLEYEQKLLDIEQDSFDKRERQNQLNLLKEFQTIEEYRQKISKEQQDAAKDIYVSKKGTDTGFNFAAFDMSLLPEGLKPSDIETQVNKMTSAALAAWKKGNADIAKELEGFADEENLAFSSQLDQQIYTIRKHYRQRRIEAGKNTDLIKVLNTNETKEILAAKLQAHQRQLESDADYNQKYLELTSNRFVFEADKRKAALKQQIEDQKKIINSIKGQLRNDPFNIDLSNQLRNAQINLKGLENDLKKAPADKLMEMVGYANHLSDAFGESTEALSEALDLVGSVAQGFAQGGWIGGAVALATNIIDSAVKKSEQEEQTKRNLLKLQYEFNKELREQNYNLIESVDYSRVFADNIEALLWLVEKGFISDKQYSVWTALFAGKEEAKKNLDTVQKEYDDFIRSTADKLNVMYDASQKSTGGIPKAAKDILNEWKSGAIDTEKAIRKLSEVQGTGGFKESLDILNSLNGELDKYTNELVELMKQMEEFATGTSFDSFLSDASNAIKDLRGNILGLADFTEETLTNAILSSFKYQVLSDALKPMYNELADMFLKGDFDSSMADDWKKRLTDILNTNSKELDKIFASFGVDPDNSSNTSQSSSRGGFETITQDQAGSIDGRLTGIHENGLNILSILTLIQLDYSKLKEYGLITADGVLEIKQTLMYCMDYLANIAKSNNELYQIREDIAYLRKNGIKIN